MNVREAAALLHVHPETLRHWARNGRIPSLKVESQIRFVPSEVEEFIECRKARILVDSPSLSPIALDRYDKIYLRGGKKTLSNKNSRRCWCYGIGRIYLRQTKKGLDRWWIDYRGPEGQRRREVVKNAQNRGEALIALQQRVREVFDGKFHPQRIAKHTKFNELADRYIERVMKIKRSWKTDEYRLVSIREYFGEMDLSAITTAAILEYRQARLRSGISELTTNRERALLSAMFNFAHEEGLVKSNPASKVRAFSEQDTARTRVLSADEVQRLFAELAPHLRPIVIVALHTGMRLHEILNLKWSDVNFNLAPPVIKVERTKGKRTRFIQINSVLLSELMKLKAEQNGNGLVFNCKNIQTGFEGARRRAGLEDFTFHDLRRTFGTRLLEGGVNIVTISKFLGHSNVLVTQNYLHPSDVLSIEAVEILAQSWHTGKKSVVPVPANSMISVH